MNLLKQLKNLGSDSSSSGSEATWIVTVERAEGLKDKDDLTKSDPYLKLEFGGKSVQTRTAKNTRTPNWNEAFQFKLDSNHLTDIHVKLMDEDIGLDDSIGVGKISKGDLPAHWGEEKHLTVPILHDGEATGVIHLRIKKAGDGGSSQSYQQQSTSSYNQYNMPPTYSQPYQTQGPPMNTNYSQNPSQSYQQPHQQYSQQYPQQQSYQQPYQQQPNQSFQQPNQPFQQPYQHQQQGGQQPSHSSNVNYYGSEQRRF